SVYGHEPGDNPSVPVPVPPSGITPTPFIRLTAVPTIENFQEWTDNEIYSEGDTVRRNFKLYESLIDSNEDNDPELDDPETPVNWVEVSASENKWGETYIEDTIYSKRQVVFNEDLDKFYWLDI